MAVVRRRRGRISIVGVAVALGAWVAVLEPLGTGHGELWAFLLAAAVGEMIVLEDIRATSVPTSLAVLAAFALLGNGPIAVAAVGAGAWGAAALVEALRGRSPRPRALAGRVLAAWVMGAAASLGAGIAPGLTLGTADADVTLGAIIAVLAALLAGPAIWEFRDGSAEDTRAVRDRVVQRVGVAVALGASGALVAVAHGPLRGGALLLLLPPVLAVRAGLRRYADIRRTYDQTVVAMSRMTELTGQAEPGHGVRVADLATDIGHELGLGDRPLKVLERAGHLHELGRIVTDDPERAAKDREVAVAGAAIVREAGGMDGVADIIERHRDPYRGVGRAPDRSLPLASRIVRAACEFDRLAHGAGVDRWDALDAVQRGTAHDPEVVSALVRVVER